MSNDPYAALAVSLRENAARKAAEVLTGATAELGTVTGTGLKLDSFKYEIQDYYVAEFPGILKLPELKMTGEVRGLRDSGGGGVEGQGQFTFMPSETKDAVLSLKLQPGDRVLALPLNGGNDAIVLCRVVSGNG
ncbi:hypothetical protein [Paenibacillus barengoltzii]|uniref:Uncharacterized protein n=1 Tax=Paenibacillus barengoltzii G22 TaxID=1235795 RepID=R9LG04_9BACL|nr:hypothetical protein [Paenibacillus barengoltzii]EOS57665.1 hypothetical protein C812_00710 [Paenibacillus barengoltzii G22]